MSISQGLGKLPPFRASEYKRKSTAAAAAANAKTVSNIQIDIVGRYTIKEILL